MAKSKKDKLMLSPEQWADEISRNIFFRNYSDLAIMRIGGTFNVDTLSTTLLERSCYYYGACAVVELPEYGWVTLPVIPAGELGIYFIPTRWRAIGRGLSYEFEAEPFGTIKNYNGVVILNDSLATPDVLSVYYYTTKMAQVSNVIDNRLRAHMSPYLVKGAKQQKLTWENIQAQTLQGNNFIVVDEDAYNNASVELLCPQTEYIIDRLRDYMECLRNDCRTYLGIKSTAIKKKERAVVDEINAEADEALNGHILDMLSMRKRGAELLEKIGIIYKPEIRTETIREEVEKDGIREHTLYPDTGRADRE